ncbi:MAG: hypothetical protein H0U57_02260 [Tatlockia sp.]|nr:hypothetical protein [Tatlockia sp.]
MTSLAIDKLIEEWEHRLDNSAKKRRKLFGDTDEFNALNKLFKSLGLNRSMGINDLVLAINTLENVTVNMKKKPEQISLGESLKKNKFSTLSSYDLPTKTEETGVCTDIKSPFYNFLVKNHSTLLQHYEQAYFHSQGEIPISEVSYDTSQLQESQPFYDLETTTSMPNPKHNDTVVKDMARGGVTINGKAIEPEDADNSKDQKILDAIQTLTRDSPTNPSSRAYQILNYGGQYLEAILLEEFRNTTIFTDTGVRNLDPGLNKGQIDWYSEELPKYETGYLADIDMRIFTCASANPEKYFAIAADGSSLLHMDADEIDGVMARNSKEVQGLTTGNVVPICRIKAKVKIENSPNGYMLKVVEYNTQYYTPDLESSKAHLASRISPNKF